MKNIDFRFLEELQPMMSRIAEKKARVDAARPLSSSILSRLKEDLALEWTYNSNGIEGNSLTLVETKVVLREGMTIGGKTLREHFEAINHEKAIDYLESIVNNQYVLRAIDLLSMHELILKNIDVSYAGRIREVMVRIVGANFVPPSPKKVSDLLDELILFINENPLHLDPVILATIFHHQFVWIHPFVDGNGRTGRLAMNIVLQKNGYPPCIILKNDRKKYFSALNEANKGNYERLALMVCQGTERSLNMYINAIPNIYKEYDSLTNIANEPEISYSAEYLSLLARKGIINAHKEGRNWVTSKEDVLEYMNMVQ